MKLKRWEIIHRNRIQKIQDMKDSWETQPPRTIEEVYTAIAKARTKAQLNVLRLQVVQYAKTDPQVLAAWQAKYRVKADA